MSSFTTTKWSIVLRLGSDEREIRAAALEHLCERYWQPVYFHVRRKVSDPDQALDAAQGFFAEVIRRDSMAGADAERGRFRTFLLTLVDRFLVNEWKKDGRLKRGGGVEFISADVVEQDLLWDGAETEEDLVRAYDRDWARQVIHQARATVHAEYKGRDRGALAERLLPHLLEGGFDFTPVAEELGMTANAMKVSVHRMRRRLGDAIRAAILDTVSNPADVDSELEYLIEVASTLDE